VIGIFIGLWQFVSAAGGAIWRSGTGLLGWEDDAPLLGFEDDAPLEEWTDADTP
jgi:hypothetical protein